MPKCLASLVIAFLLVFGVADGHADTVILKSGEMFQTSKAWKEDGIVSYYRNGQVVQVAEDDVERLIITHVPTPDVIPAGKQPPETQATPESGQTVLPSPETVERAAGDDVGYLDLRWDLPPSGIDGLTPVGADSAYGGVKQYSQQKRSPRFGRARVEDIVYGFWQGGLYIITVWTGNFLDFRDLKAEAFRRFGPGVQNRKDVEKYIWTDRHTDRMLAYDFDSDVGYLWMRSKAVHRKVKDRYPD